MKQITSNTVLKQRDKSYPAIQTEQGIVWIDKDARAVKGYNYNYGLKKIEKLPWQYVSYSSEWQFCRKIIAANFVLKEIPKIELEDEKQEIFKAWAKIKDTKDFYTFQLGYKANQAKYTEEDMGNLWQFIVDGAKQIMLGNDPNIGNFEEYLQSLNSIKEITVDENFKIIN